MFRRCICKDRSWLSRAAALVLVFQPYTSSIASTVVTENSLDSAAVQVKTIDVALRQGGVLRGQVVNNAGFGVAEATVELANGQQHWQTTTDAKGWFRVVDLRGGIYQFHVAGQSQVLRAWAAGTTPPGTSQSVLVVPTTDVVRGQRVVSPRTNQFFRFSKQKLTNPWVVGGIVATAVTIPVAIHNADDDDPPATP